MAVLDELLVRLGVDMSEAEGEIDRGAQGIENRLTGLQAAGGVAAAGLGAAFVMGLQSAMDISSVTTQLQNQLDLTDEEAARAGSIAGDVFSAGFGDSLGDVGEALDSVASSMQEFGSISDKEMTQLTKDALALSKTFAFDVGEAALGAGNLIKAGLAKDGTEAMDLMAAAAQKMPKAMREELPAVTKEYSEFFAQLGATGPEMMGALAEASKNPLFEIDKLGDAVKEFTLRIADTGAVAEPLKELGLDVGEIQSMVNKGQGTKAFDEITKALAGVENQTDRTRIAAALMGGPGEDAQASLKAFGEAGGFAGNKLKDVAGSAKAVADAMEDDPAQQFDSIMRTVSTTLGEMLLPALTFVSELFKEHPGLVQALVPAVLALAAAMSIAAIAVWAMNSAMLANPIFWIIAGIAAAVAGIVILIVMYWDEIKSATEAAWSWVVDKVIWAKDAVLAAIDWLGQIPGKIAGWFNQAKDWAIRKAMELLTWLQGLPGRTSSALSGLLGALRQRATSAFQGLRYAAVQRALSLVSWVRGLPGRLSRAIGSLGSLLYGKGQDVIRGLWNGIKSMGSWIWGKAKDFVGGIVDSVKSGFGIFSPSRVMAKEVGRFLPPGIVEGAEDEAPAMNKALNSMVDIDNLSGFNAGGRARMGVQPAGAGMRVEFAPGGGDAFTDWLMETIRIRFGGDVAQLGQG
ncbi:phage tail tape measure protein [Streptomyces sp. Lzd4kr]|nr:phage tail tape measure protein [Streptomyces sp. Lzd4kr]